MKNVAIAIVGILFLLLVAGFVPVHADETPAVHVAAGVNGAWMDGPNANLPADFEAGGTAWSSLSPHFSLVGGAFYGFSHSYIRWDAGWRGTLTDADNPNLNAFLGIKLRGGSTSRVGPTEWAGDVGVGWKPSPDTYPNLTLGADASYGIDSQRLLMILAARWTLPLN